MSPLRKNARVAGLLYILASVVGFLRLGYIPKVLFVHGNATGRPTTSSRTSDNDDFESYFPRSDGRSQTGGSSSNHEYIEFVCHTPGIARP